LANVISKSGKTRYLSQLTVVRNLTEAFAEKKDVKIIFDDEGVQTSSDSDETIQYTAELESYITKKDEPNVSDPPNIKPQHREKYAGRPSTQTAIGILRSIPKPSLRIRKNKHLSVISIGKSPAKKPKTETKTKEVFISHSENNSFLLIQ